MLQRIPGPAPPQTEIVASSCRTRLVALIVASALFMQNLDSTVVATALPSIAHAFGADPLHMNVALTSYLLSLTMFIPASGWLADKFGARTVFRAAIIAFTAASILCGQANSLTSLVVARLLQGAGGAMMVPIGRLVILRSTAKSELVAAMAWLTAPALIGPVLGPPLGGFLVTYASWRWIFYINVPIGILGVTLATLFIEDMGQTTPRRLDARGLVLSGTALAGLIAGLETGGRGLVAPSVTVSLLAIGALATAGYARHAMHHEDPILDFRLMRVPTFAVSVIAGSLFRIGVGAIPFLLPLMLQLGFNDTPLQSGLVTLASSAGALAMKPVAQRLLHRFGFRAALIWNGALSAAFLASCAVFRPSWPVLAISAVLLVGGFIRSLQFTAYNAMAYADIPSERMSSATSLYSTLRQLSLTLGITIGAIALELATLLSQHRTPALLDFSVAFLIVAIIAACASPVALRLAPDAGAELSGRPVRAHDHSALPPPA